MMRPLSTTVGLSRICNPGSFLQTHDDDLCHSGVAQWTLEDMRIIRNERVYSGEPFRQNMTSIIQTMNSRGVAFATDSAVSYGKYSLNSAQKLFCLPGRQPIAFMLMGSGTFAPAGLSWDRIFYKYNLYYSEKYGPEKELDSVDNYEEDFINFLATLVSDEDNKRALVRDIWNNWAGQSGIMSNGGYYNEPEEDLSREDTDEITNTLESYEPKDESENKPGLDAISRLIDDWTAKSWWMSEESFAQIDFQYKVEQLEKIHADDLKLASEWIMMSAISLGRVWSGSWEEKRNLMTEADISHSDILIDSLYNMLKRWLAAWGNIHSWKANGSLSEIVFGGFGSKDEFPKTIQIATGSRVRGLGNSSDLVKSRNTVDPNYEQPFYDEEKGEWRGATFLEALAQNEFIMRMTTGLSSSFRNGNLSRFVQNGLEGWLKNGAINDFSGVEGIDEASVESIISHLQQIKMPEDFARYFNSWVYDEQIAVKNDFWDAVHRLSPVELAELASNLIEIQAKMHKIINPQSSVDLPVDSCYLSKETGFIWHARKNMPDTDLNPRIKSMDWKGSQIR